MNFIGLFRKFAYGNIYIYNLLNYFSRHIYFYSTFEASINDVIILFDQYLQANPKLYVVYIDAGLYFTSPKLHIYF